VADDSIEVRTTAKKLLQEEAKLEEIVRLVGMDALSPKERLTLETAKSIREDFLFQNAFDEMDAYTSLKKQYWMLKCIVAMYHAGLDVVENEEFDFDNLKKLPVLKKVVKVKDIKEGDWAEFEALEKEVHSSIKSLK
jgi:V/A-type H+-transporting ATPase subunit A